MSVSRIYKQVITAHTICGVVGGLYYGNTLAKDNYSNKDELTPIEYVGEMFCVSTITLSVGFLGGLTGTLWGISCPLYIPVAAYYHLNNKQRTTMNSSALNDNITEVDEEIINETENR